ncbi:hypothetical protein GHT06_016342 [Daphnia sinensis]|uniref:Protein Wnt n=1 Tax=Daphnia sinensis TaxID=1820382 RepID=A0AAD5KQ30_9CRUS|nr:hypothetical protein GHT06_016342 [Daphnia sinensis]
MSSDRIAGYPKTVASFVLLFLLLRPVTCNWMHLGLSGTSPSLTMPPQSSPTDQAPDQQMDQATMTQGSARAICAALPGLVSRQIQVCQAHPNTIQSVSDGARKGIQQCQHQFRNERWNCTTKDDQNVFGATLERGSRETAFIYAVTSAGVVHAVTQACSLGNLTECSCDMERQGLPAPDGWKWGGCSDNIRYGIQFARQFVDAPEKAVQKKPKNVRNLMNLHNNEAGRKAIATLMRMQCRCHGVSGENSSVMYLHFFNQRKIILNFKFFFFVCVCVSVCVWNGVAKNRDDRLLRVEDVLENDAHICPGGRLPKTEIRERRPGYCAEDVTGSEPPTSEAATTPVTEDNSAGTQSVTTSSMQTIGLDVTDGSTADSSQSTENNNQTETDLAEIALSTSGWQSSDVPVTVSEETISTNQQDVASSPEPSVSGSPGDGTTLNILPETTVTVQSTSSTTIRLTEKPITTSSITDPTAGNANSSTMTAATPVNSTIDSTTSTTVSPTTTYAGTTTRRPTRSPRTTTQRRSSTTTAPLHECVTSTTCLDPNAHCVNFGGHNTCECRMGYRKSSPIGRCVLIASPSTTTMSILSTTTSSTIAENSVAINQSVATLANSNGPNVNVTSSPSESSLTVPPLSTLKNPRDAVRLASNLSTREKMDVVSISFQPASSVVEWLLSQDTTFRKAIAKILSSTNFTIVEATETTKMLNISEDEILYVAPSPQLTAEGLLVCFLVQDKEKVTSRHRSVIGGIVARRKRETNSTDEISTGYLPSVWITTAIRNSQHHLEAALNQTVSALYGGIIPYQLLSVEQLAAASLFERRLDIFIPLILVAALGFMGLAVSLVCIRAKTRSMATWDPPAGVVFGKTSINRESREDPLGCTSKPDSTGNHLATDEQCRDGEEQLMKNSSEIHADDDVWVVPYEDGPPQGNPGHMKTQYEDTKL